jgi:hypothetical protein
MYIVVVSFILISTISNLWFFVMRRTILEFINKINEIDEKLVEMKAPVELFTQKRFILLFILFVKILSWTAVVATETLGKTTGAFRTNLIMMITMAVNVQMWIFVNCQFICLTYSLRLRFERINLFLKKAFLDVACENIEEGISKLKEAANLYEKVSEVCDDMNRYYGFPVKNL